MEIIFANLTTLELSLLLIGIEICTVQRFMPCTSGIPVKQEQQDSTKTITRVVHFLNLYKTFGANWGACFAPGVLSMFSQRAAEC